MEEKENLVKVQFWVDRATYALIKEFARTFPIAASDLYKGGAVMLMNCLSRPSEITLNLFTRSFKDLEKSQLQKKILKKYQESRSVY